MKKKGPPLFLVVDDDPGMRALVRSQLTNIGYPNIQEADNGRTALEKVHEIFLLGDTVDFIVSDWNMPEMSGLEFIENLRKDPAFHKIPCILLTTESSFDGVVRAIQQGVTAYLIKPTTEELLLEKIKAEWTRVTRMP